MARLAATDYGADWVINTDADEFWMPRGGTIKEMFAAVPEPYGVVWALSRHFVRVRTTTRFFAERMTVRVSAPAAINDPTSPYRPHLKAAHRADPDDRRRARVAHRLHATLARAPALAPVPTSSTSRSAPSSSGRGRACGVRAGDKPLGQYVRALHASESGRAASATGRCSSTTPSSSEGWRRRARRGHAAARRAASARARHAADALACPRSDASVIAEACADRGRRAGVRTTPTWFASPTPGRAPYPRPVAGGPRPGTVATRLADVKLVSVVVLRDDADILDAHLRFHLNAGVDLALVAEERTTTRVASVLEPYVERAVTVVRRGEPRAELARVAVTEHGADWVLPADADEFWWPRGESLKDVLAAIPPRYEVVQGLVRVFSAAGAATGSPSPRA